MHVLMVPDAPLEGICPRWRCVTPARALEKLGHTVEYWRPKKYYPDVVFFNRPIWSDAAALVRSWRQRGVPVVCDVDDFLLPGAVPEEHHNIYLGIESVGWGASLHASFKEASAITVSTSEFLPHLGEYRCDDTLGSPRPISVLPNLWDDQDPQWVTAPAPRKKRSRVDLAMLGSVTHSLDLAWIKDTLAYVLRNPEVRVWVTKGNEVNLRGLPRVKTAPFVDWKQYSRFLQRFDVVLAPLAPCLLNDCKSWIRLLEANLAGLPWVASATGPYTEYHQVAGWNTGIVAADREGYRGPTWTEALTSLLLDPEKRRLQGEAGRQSAVENFAISDHIELWVDFFTRVIEREIGARP